ncbi:hypothetical protein DSO57_1017677 [Entomophthora muscae]|uniref:Uncharacterized protein n=1 Tax=Entomophthora muscae TaxID=34485 RepID=A0ACC2SHC9_9FUNG|nr:hypothetical protein DSO57_1017677 [Entomophthora muscae]
MLVMSYGQPKVANQVFVNYFRSFGFPYMRIINEDDWITQSLAGSNLAHTNKEIYFQDGTALQCRKHDSECSLPLTFSYQQHLKVGDRSVGSMGC